MDLRSDTVTKPTQKMRQAIYQAKVGDDVFQEDDSINELQEYGVKIFAKPASLFFPTGTQAGLCTLLSHCQRGDEYICGQDSHIYKYEGGGGAVLGGIQPQPIENNDDGTLDLAKVTQAIKPIDFHFAKTKLLCLENTIMGKTLTMKYMEQAKDLAKSKNLNIHLDGARIFNAAIELKCDVRDILKHFDSATICLSKGLSAPIGTLLVGEKDFIKQALRWRKMCGGGMRQAGFMAAAAKVALEESPLLLIEDHKKANSLQKLLKKRAKLKAVAHTNMVFFEVPASHCKPLQDDLLKAGFKSFINPYTRIVFHKDIAHQEVLTLAKVILDYFA
ncbi:MAG: low-specificity L-threonine aldolase [SAR324 cluster bacterium]|nr:low-specificity L-threonine aldolase [SAR324 cluster bacterium]